MYSERIKIFHVTNGDAVVLSVSYNLVLNFLPALEGSFHEDLEG
jgi:hypothetical protein